MNFGLAYGNTPYGLYEVLRFQYLIKETTQEKAEHFHKTWCKTYPGVPKWREEQLKKAYSPGEVYNKYGRSRQWARAHVKLETEKYNPVLNQASNFPIQSSCLEMVYETLGKIRMENPAIFKGLRALIHDEFQSFLTTLEEIKNHQKKLEVLLESAPLPNPI